MVPTTSIGESTPVDDKVEADKPTGAWHETESSTSRTLYDISTPEDGRTVWFCGSSGAIGVYEPTEQELLDYSAPGEKTSTWEIIAVGGTKGREYIFVGSFETSVQVMATFIAPIGAFPTGSLLVLHDEAEFQDLTYTRPPLSAIRSSLFRDGIEEDVAPTVEQDTGTIVQAAHLARDAAAVPGGRRGYPFQHRSRIRVRYRRRRGARRPPAVPGVHRLMPGNYAPRPDAGGQ